MLLVDPRVLESHSHYAPPEPLKDNLRDLDALMQQVLDRDDLLPRDKARLYQQTLRRYMTRLEQHRSKPLGIVDIKPPSLPPIEQLPSVKEEDKPIKPQSPEKKRRDEYVLRKRKTSKIPTPRKEWGKWPRD